MIAVGEDMGREEAPEVATGSLRRRRSGRCARGTCSPDRWRENEPPRAPPVSHRDDDLSDLLVRLQVAVSRDDFLKRKRGVPQSNGTLVRAEMSRRSVMTAVLNGTPVTRRS